MNKTESMLSRFPDLRPQNKIQMSSMGRSEGKQTYHPKMKQIKAHSTLWLVLFALAKSHADLKRKSALKLDSPLVTPPEPDSFRPFFSH